MYLEKLELQGFKSFAKKTVLEFLPGITAIVGPNGSGKSNIADAVRWVLGEQSLKTLRGKKSEDIIFFGSKEKSRLGAAEVSLYLNNEDRRVPLDWSQIVITRRLYRSGESEYLINKNKVRLLDIQELLARAGFGQKTYSVIGQGMVDAILQASPKERKEFFEEAAGIKQYQIKKNISLNKLDQTKQNLIRVSDLLTEIEPRLRSLKRQANKVQKKKEIEKKLVAYQKQYFSHAWNEAKKKITDIEKRLLELKEKEINYGEMVRKIEKSLENLRKTDISEKFIKQKELNLLHDKKNKLKGRLAIILGRIQIEKERKEKTNLLVAKHKEITLNKEIKELKKQKERLEKDLLIKEKNIHQIHQEQIESSREIKICQEKLSSFQTYAINKLELIDIERALEQIYQKGKEFCAKIEKCNRLEQLNHLKFEAKRHQQNIKNLFERIKQETAKKTKIQANLILLQKKLVTLFKKKANLDSRLSDVKTEIVIYKTRIQFIKGQLLKKQNEQEILKKQEDTWQNAKRGTRVLELEKEKKRIEEALAEHDKQIEILENEIKREIKEVKEERYKISELEKEHKKMQHRLNMLRDARQEIEIEQAKQISEKEILASEIKDSFGSDVFSQMIQEFEKNSINPENNKDELKKKIKGLKKQLIKIGEIDPAVIPEFQECKKRYDFLSSQKRDLEQALLSLKKIITELDEAIAKKFDIAFKRINEQFQKYFRILFGGGRARLVKKLENINFESEDQIKMSNKKVGGQKNFSSEMVIDIKAIPPGKKLRDLNMLSGGEKALTSIALLFAIIANNPSPFILLDEVDAALDEVNSSRYAEIVDSMAKKTQFITITHNRETMKRAKTLYGVTMDESGVSTLLSMKLDDVPASE